MALHNCISTKIKSNLINPIKGKKAQERFKEISDGLIKQGEAPQIAYALAAQRVKDEVKWAAAKAKRRLITDVNVRKQLAKAVDDASSLTSLGPKMLDSIDFEGRAIHRQAVGRMIGFLKKHHPNLFGKVSNPADFAEFMKARWGQPSKPNAKAVSDAVGDVLEYFRTSLNAYGYAIGKLDSYDLPHKHNRIAIGRATFGQWFSDIASDLDWTKMMDERVGRPFSSPPPEAFQRDFLESVYKNIVYGRGTKGANFGRRGGGTSSLERHRILHFKDSEAWAKYNMKYGATSPFNALMDHVADMSRELALARRLGYDHSTALDFLGQLVAKKAREKDAGLISAMKAEGSMRLAKGMLNVMSGGVGPNGYWGAISAQFFSTTRKVLSAALLDRAAVISVPSDMNSARLAAQAIGMNPSNVLSTYVGLMADAVKGGGMTQDDLARQMWIADSFANPTVTASRYEDELLTAEWASVMSNAAMRVQGLAAHTDNLKLAWQFGMAGHFASMRKLDFSKIPDALRNDMATEAGITAKDWDDFRDSGGEFVSGNGAVFLNPLMWRELTSLPDSRADELFMKLQSYVERWTERAVPSRSLMAQGVISPKAYGLAPGGPIYEIVQSAGMFKSFPAAFLMNQMHMVRAQQGWGRKSLYVIDLIGSSTLIGALAMQVNEILMGRDPQDMTETSFWARALLRGGGLGPVGDILATGAASWGGGIQSYVAGPIPQLADSAIKLTFGNMLEVASQLINGEEVDTNFAKELATFGKRYTPMGQTVAIGPALDRLLWDQLQLLLDPDSADAMLKAAQSRANAYGSGTAWLPGDLAPSRLPDIGNALGQ